MQLTRMGFFFVLLFVVFDPIYQETAHAAPYKVENIGIPGQTSLAGAMNENGQAVIYTLGGEVVGNEIDGYDLSFPGAVYLVEDYGQRKQLFGLGGPQDRAFDINNSVVVAGESNFEFLVTPKQGVLWSEENATSLPPPSGNTLSYQALSVNDSGVVLVTEQSSHVSNRSSYIYTENDGYSQLPNVNGVSALGSDVNNFGHVVGGSEPDKNGVGVPFLWDGNTVISLGSLGGSRGNANAINGIGHVAGTSQTVTGENHAFVWDPVNGMRDLGTLNGLWSASTDINDMGVVIGSLFDPQISQPSIAFIYDETKGIRLLEEIFPANSGWEGPFTAVSINNRGQILGNARFQGETQVFKLSLIPEPSSLALISFAAVGLLKRSS